MKNPGKVFEEDFKNSVPSYCMVHRLKDSAESYNKSSGTKFTWNNPCDFFVFNSYSHILYAIECKSTKYKTFSFEREKDEKNKKMVKYHQIKSLTDLSKYDGILSGFIFNFRDEENDSQRTYFQRIDDFNEMCDEIQKNSFNEMDLLLNNAIKIDGRKKRVRYSWEIDRFLRDSEDKFYGE